MVAFDVSLYNTSARKQREFASHGTGLSGSSAGDLTEMELFAGVEEQERQDFAAVRTEEQGRWVGNLICSHLGDDSS